MTRKRSNKRPRLNSAEFNLREITKQLILLEDHLSDDEKYCPDCIRKHLLWVEALAEESLAMDPGNKYSNDCKTLASHARKWMKDFADKVPKTRITQNIRKKRKKLVEVTYDPRSK